MVWPSAIQLVSGKEERGLTRGQAVPARALLWASKQDAARRERRIWPWHAVLSIRPASKEQVSLHADLPDKCRCRDVNALLLSLPKRGRDNKTHTDTRR